MDKDKKNRPPNDDQLLRLDKDLARLLVRRSKALAKTARQRRDQGQILVDPRQEKRLWASWQAVLQENGLDPRHWRHVFQAINGLAYSQAERRSTNPLTIQALKSAPDLQLKGPADSEQACLCLAAALASNSPLVLKDVLLNDQLHECYTALNQAEGKLEREKDRIRSTVDSSLCFDNKTIHCGGNALNLALTLTMGLTEAGNTKITGNSRLRLVDLSSATELFAQFGARLVPLTPGSQSIPLRLERSGYIPDKVKIPAQTPSFFLPALLIASLRFPHRLVLDWPQGQANLPGSQKALAILDQVNALEGCSPFSACVNPGQARFPSSIETKLDPVLAGFLLAWPLIGGARVQLQGQLDQEAPLVKELITLLEAVGLRLRLNPYSVSSSLEQRPAKPDCTASRPLLHLATALACLASGRLEVPDPDASELAQDFLTTLGHPYTKDRAVLDIQGPPGPAVPRYIIGDPLWGLAAVLYSLRFGPVELKNPGEISAIWPQFWNTIPQLSKAERPSPRPERTDQPGPRRRKVIKD
jgi:3-phosphoshikimate 1-carboxyvinyltransferase